MRNSKIKDLILKDLTNNSGHAATDKAANRLKIKHSTIYALTKEIAADGFIRALETSTYNHPYGLSYSMRPEGEHFIATTSYRKKAFWNDVQSLPKKYWFIGALFVSIGFNVKDAIEYFEKQKQAKAKTNTSQQPVKSVSNHNNKLKPS
jgi:hypothetical protein